MKNNIIILTLLLLLAAPFSVAAQTAEAPFVAPEELEFTVDGQTFARPFPTTLEETQQLLIGMVQQYEIAANLAITTSKDNGPKLKELLTKNEGIQKAIQPLNSDVQKLRDTVEALRINQAKLFALGAFVEGGYSDPLNAHASFGPLVQVNLFNSALFSLGVGGHFGLKDGLGLIGTASVSIWLF